MSYVQPAAAGRRSVGFIVVVVFHAVLFYVAWLLPPLLLVSLFTSDKRCLHDILADVIVLRRSSSLWTLRI